jgi:hypothetical protein
LELLQVGLLALQKCSYHLWHLNGLSTSPSHSALASLQFDFNKKKKKVGDKVRMSLKE